MRSCALGSESCLLNLFRYIVVSITFNWNVLFRVPLCFRENIACFLKFCFCPDNLGFAVWFCFGWWWNIQTALTSLSEMCLPINSAVHSPNDGNNHPLFHYSLIHGDCLFYSLTAKALSMKENHQWQARYAENITEYQKTHIHIYYSRIYTTRVPSVSHRLQPANRRTKA